MEEYYTNNKNYKSERKCPKMSATIYGLGLVKKGLDNNLWKVVSNVNEHKYWIVSKINHKYKLSRSVSNSVSDYDKNDKFNILKRSEFTDLINKSNYSIKYTITNLRYVISELTKLGYITEIIPLSPLSAENKNNYYINHINDYMNNWNGSNWNKNKYIIFYVYLNNTSTDIIEDYKIGSVFSFMTLNDKKILIDLLNKRLPNQCEWSGKNSDKLIIDYNYNYNVNDILSGKYYSELSLNIKYPLLSIYVSFNESINVDNIINNIKGILSKNEMNKLHYEYDKHNLEMIIEDFELSMYYNLEDSINNFVKQQFINKYAINYLYN